jgi:hypothetical protein
MVSSVDLTKISHHLLCPYSGRFKIFLGIWYSQAFTIIKYISLPVTETVALYLQLLLISQYGVLSLTPRLQLLEEDISMVVALSLCYNSLPQHRRCWCGRNCQLKVKWNIASMRS